MNEWAVGDAAYYDYAYRRGGYLGNRPWGPRPLGYRPDPELGGAPAQDDPETREWKADVLSGIVSGVVVAVVAPLVYRALLGRRGEKR